MTNKQTRTFEELLETAEMKDFLFRAERDLFPKMAASAINLMIFTGGSDAKLALELGAALLLEKPIILLALKGSRVPPKLRRIADRIVEVESVTEPGAQEKLQRAISAVLGKEQR